MNKWKRRALGWLTLIPGVTWREGAPPPPVAEGSISVDYGGSQQQANLKRKLEDSQREARQAQMDSLLANSSLFYQETPRNLQPKKPFMWKDIVQANAELRAQNVTLDVIFEGQNLSIEGETFAFETTQYKGKADEKNTN